MRVVVAGATGLTGSRTVARLRDHGVEVVPLSRADGVDLSTGEGLALALRGADVVVDVTDAPSRRQEAATEFFTSATEHLARESAAAGVGHHVVLSLVGADQVDSGYFLAKSVQERLVRHSPVPWSVVRATPFFETVAAVAAEGTRKDGIHVPPLLTRPVSVDDVVASVAHVAMGLPLLDVLETAGPEEARLTDFAAELLQVRGRTAQVLPDPRAPFFGATLPEKALVPGPDAHRGHHTFTEWLAVR
ncbi:SDR family oxidoreductase [Streptomyces longwoodensis]|uniref:SDR family oxidoreductase n=1 Tax=Streptomyces longwoodensis TaxID=68231 RepID=UPI00384ED719